MIVGTDAARYLAGPFIGACALLVVAGARKLLHPLPARAAAAAAGVRIPRRGIAVFGLGELSAGGAGVVFGGSFALAVAAFYVVLTVVAVRLLTHAPATPCACLGSSTAVVTRTHVVLDVAAVCLALVAATGASPFAQLSGRWLEGAVFVVLVACCVKLAALALETLPELAAATKEGMS